MGYRVANQVARMQSQTTVVRESFGCSDFLRDASSRLEGSEEVEHARVDVFIQEFAIPRAASWIAHFLYHSFVSARFKLTAPIVTLLLSAYRPANHVLVVLFVPSDDRVLVLVHETLRVPKISTLICVGFKGRS